MCGHNPLWKKYPRYIFRKMDKIHSLHVSPTKPVLNLLAFVEYKTKNKLTTARHANSETLQRFNGKLLQTYK